MILFICSQETDYLQDLTYAGLAEILGRERVVDFPFHWPYHREKKFLWSKKTEYPRNLGLVQTPRFLQSHPQSPRRQRGINRSSWKVRKELKKNSFQIVVLGSAKPDALQALERLLPAIKVPWIFLDGGDWREVGGDFKRTGGQRGFGLFQSVSRKKSPSLVFKREMPLDLRNDFIFPFPFSAQVSRIPKLLPSASKKYQVLFWAVESSEARRQAFKLLRGRYDCEQNGSVPGQTFRGYSFHGRQYFEALNETRVALSFRGEGFDTLRFWEIPACGSLLLSEKPTVQIPHPFEDRVHAVFCKNDLSDLVTLIDYYISHEKEAQEIAEEGQKHLLRYHTHMRRGEYFLERVRSRMKIRLGR